jgi:UDPglucose--hexose-1-phosphate uridylyltransferase
MHALELRKPDGRALTLYGLQPLDAGLQAPSPFPEPLQAAPHLRWHPLRGEWVTYAAYRQGRTYLPPPDWNPLAPQRDAQHPTEVPAGAWDIAVFDNRFPSLGVPAGMAPPRPHLTVPTGDAVGACEVVVFDQDPQGALARLPLARIELLLQVWADRSRRLAARGDVRWVLPFENRGVEMGVTLHHPHGQIYAYPVLPPVPERMQEVAAEHLRLHGMAPLTQLVAAERLARERLLYDGPHAVAFVPPCARYPYEAWVAPVRRVPDFAALTAEERADLARALKTVLLKYDGLWQRPFPYLMAWYQAPCDGGEHPEWHLHAQLWPPYRTPERLKFLAGTELGAGFYAMDALPEDKARELQQVQVHLE